MSADLSRLAIGTAVPGTKWVVCGTLGEGGMGRVLEVVKEPGIRGAMKIIRPDVGRRPDFEARFLNEVRLLTSLEHRNIVRVFDFDRIDEQTPFVVMELLIGGTLRQVLRARGRALPAPTAYEITRQVCEGLGRAHSVTPSIVHRDLKPENIFLHGPGRDQPVVKIMDFGLATLADCERDHPLFGTPRYIAPEQLRGERVTPRCDLYSAALVLYEMLTGRLPWDFDVVRFEDAHLDLPPPPPSRFAPWIPPSVDAHILSALAKDPAERPRDVVAFMAGLDELPWAEGSSRPDDLHAEGHAFLADVDARSEEPSSFTPPGSRLPRGVGVGSPSLLGRPQSAAVSALVRRHSVELAAFAGTVAFALPALIFVARGCARATAHGSPMLASTASIAPPVAPTSWSPSDHAQAGAAAWPSPLPSEPSMAAAAASAGPLPATAARESTVDPASSAAASHPAARPVSLPLSSVKPARRSVDSHLPDVAPDFLPWPDRP